MTNRKSLYSSLFALMFFAACTKEPEKTRANPKGNPLANVAPSTSNQTAGELEKTSTGSASTNLLQKSVARVLAFVDIAGMNVNIYQDAYSSLYNNLNENQKTGNNQPLIYFSPIFVTDSVKLSILPSNELELRFNNRVTNEFIRPMVVDRLSKTMPNLDKNKISIVPLDNVDGKIKAFGQEFKVEVTKDLRIATARIPMHFIPEEILTEVPQTSGQTSSAPARAIDQKKLLEAINVFSIYYTYYVQTVTEENCGVTVSDTFIDNMFQNSDCPGTAKGPDAPSSFDYAAFSKANSVENFSTILQQVSKPISRCLLGRESENLQSQMNVSCTKKASANGVQNQFSNEMMQFMTQVVQPLYSSTVIDPNHWSKQAAVAATALFGNPDAFKSKLEKFKNALKTENLKEVSEDDLKAAKDFLRTLNEHATRSASSSGTSQNSAGGGQAGISIFGLFGFGAGGGKSSGSANVSSSENDFFDHSERESLTDRLTRLKKYMQERGLDHKVEEREGDFNFYPNVTIATAADIDKRRDLARSFKSNNLGDIAQEREEITAELNKRKEVRLQGTVMCEGAPSSDFSILLHQNEWWNAPSFFEELSAKVTEGIGAVGCSSVELQMYYTGASTNRDLVPKRMTLNFVASGENQISPRSAKVEIYHSNTNVARAGSGVHKVPDGSPDKFKKAKITLGAIEQ